MNAAEAAGKGNYGEAALELGLAALEMLRPEFLLQKHWRERQSQW
jgi:hypothetical protein